MNLRFNNLGLVAVAGLALTFAACGDDDGNGSGNGGNGGNGGMDAGNGGNGGMDAGNGGNGGMDATAPDPCEMADCVDLTFTIDDSANDSWGSVSGAGLAWNDFGRSPDSNIIPLTNDGSGVWSITVQEPVPDSDASFGYGANASWTSPDFAGGTGDWIWAYDSREVGNYMISASAADGDDIEVPGLTIPAFGAWDVRVQIDGSNLADGFDASGGVAIKTSRNAFYVLDLSDTVSEGVYTFQVSEEVGANADDAAGGMAAGGLFAPGDTMEFTPLIGGQEYKSGGGIRQGISAQIRDTTDEANPWIDLAIMRSRNDRNTSIKALPTRQIDIRVKVDNSMVDGALVGSGAPTAETPVFFTSSWIMVQGGEDTFYVAAANDDGDFGDETEGDGIWTLVASEWVGAEWARQSADLRGSGLFARGDDPLDRDMVPDGSDSRFKIRFNDGDFYDSLDGVTVEYRVPGGDWVEITEFPLTGAFGNDYGLRIPAAD